MIAAGHAGVYEVISSSSRYFVWSDMFRVATMDTAFPIHCNLRKDSEIVAWAVKHLVSQIIYVMILNANFKCLFRNDHRNTTKLTTMPVESPLTTIPSTITRCRYTTPRTKIKHNLVFKHVKGTILSYWNILGSMGVHVWWMSNIGPQLYCMLSTHLTKFASCMQISPKKRNTWIIKNMF